jgi:GDP-L-fucose synthase
MKKIYVAGHNGMVGSAIVRQLEKQEDVEIVIRSRCELDLTNQQAVCDFFESEAVLSPTIACLLNSFMKT